MSLSGSSTMSAHFIFREYAKFKREMDTFDAKRKKTAEIAVRVQASKLQFLLKMDLRFGKAGNRAFAPLRAISKGNPASQRRPLSGLSRAVRYWSDGRGSFSVGFNSGAVVNMKGMGSVSTSMVKSVSQGLKERRVSNRLSASWIRIADASQEGYSTRISSWRRKMLAREGGRFQKKKKHQEYQRFFFLRKTTTIGIVPARPIIEPFWDEHEKESAANIVSNFERKMRGERI